MNCHECNSSRVGHSIGGDAVHYHCLDCDKRWDVEERVKCACEDSVIGERVRDLFLGV